MTDDDETIALTARIAAAFVIKNRVAVEELPALLSDTYAALVALNNPSTPAARLVPAVSIRRSVTLDAIICLDDGLAFKSLRRHISVKYGLTPGEYRTRWGLPADYPMTAPNYSAQRAELARGFGLQREKARKAISTDADILPTQPAKRGRPKKASSPTYANKNPGGEPRRSS